MVTAYPVAGKRKSYDICEAFVAGCRGSIVSDGKLHDGPAFFYGIDESNVAIWRAIRTDLQRDFYYCDNSYFDPTRGTHFRVTKNRTQHSGAGSSDHSRWNSLGVEMQSYRLDDAEDYILLCPQSKHFMIVVDGVYWDWEEATRKELREYTQREIRTREWSSNKAKLSRTLPADLDGACALVTWSSAAAITALIAGVPVVCTSPVAAAKMMGGSISEVENLPTPSDRVRWASVLADNQWTLSEMQSGMAWEKLQ